VRLYRGDFSQKKEYGPAANFFESFIEKGIKRIHVVDLEAAEKGGRPNRALFLRYARENPGVTFQFGGGLRTRADIEEVSVWKNILPVLGTFLFDEKAPDYIRAHPGRFIAALDFKGTLRSKGWQEEGENLVEELLELPCESFLVTDIARDGTLDGVENHKIFEFLDRKGKFILSGGVAAMEEIRNADKRLFGIIVGRAFYEGKISLEDLTAASL